MFKIVLLSIAVFAVLGGLLGLLIGIFSKLFHVEEDTRIASIISLLPGANCGGCGYPGCSGMADAIVSGKANPRQCKPIKAENVAEINKVLEEYLEKNK